MDLNLLSQHMTLLPLCTSRVAFLCRTNGALDQHYVCMLLWAVAREVLRELCARKLSADEDDITRLHMLCLTSVLSHVCDFQAI